MPYSNRSPQRKKAVRTTGAWYLLMAISGIFGFMVFPMGYIVIKSKRMPVWLGRIIILGGIGYLITTIIRYAGIDFSFNRFLILPATIGEFWMIGYLLIFGIRTSNE